MSWHISTALMTAYANSPSSPGQEEASLAVSSSDGAPSAPSNGNPIPPLYLPEGRMRAFSSLSRYGMTFRPLTEPLGAALLTWFREGFPARTSAAPEREQASQGKGPGCGSTWRGSLARYDPDTCSWRTHQYSLLGDLELFSETWPRWGTMRNGECSERMTPEHLTEENAYGYSLPTPTATDYKGGTMKRRKDGSDRTSQFRHWILEYHGLKYPIPEHSEICMGFPERWTALRPSETPRFQLVSCSHGTPCTNAFKCWELKHGINNATQPGSIQAMV